MITIHGIRQRRRSRMDTRKKHHDEAAAKKRTTKALKREVRAKANQPTSQMEMF